MSRIVKDIYVNNLINGRESKISSISVIHHVQREIQGNLHEPERMEIKLNRSQQSFQRRWDEKITTQSPAAELKFSQRQDNNTN